MSKSLEECVQNAPERKEYVLVLKKLKSVLHDLPPKIIAIDGKAGAGKTTLGRFLAWRFNISLLETDLFLYKNKGKFIYRKEDINAVIQSRMDSNRPIIVEGIVSLRLLKELNLEPAFHIRVDCSGAENSHFVDKIWQEYSSEFELAISESLTLDLPAEN